jgi:hypothetical protein
MHDPLLMLRGVIAIVTRSVGTRPSSDPTSDPIPDRGAVSIEQVLWYAAAAISVAVVAAIIWSQIRDTASTPVQAPSAP